MRIRSNNDLAAVIIQCKWILFNIGYLPKFLRNITVEWYHYVLRFRFTGMKNIAQPSPKTLFFVLK